MVLDRVGREVNVGDTVAYCTVKYSDLSVGKVLKVTPTGISVPKKRNDSGTLYRSSEQFVIVSKGGDDGYI